jgi:hypothetical protein
MPKVLSSAKCFAMGVAVAGAALVYAPMASAEPLPMIDCGEVKPDEEPRTPQHQQLCDEQQQRQQQQGPSIPDIPDLPQNQSQQGPQVPKPPADNPNGVDLADKNCWVVGGVPTMWSPTVVTPPGTQSWPCYYVYGLTPH